LNFLLLHHGHDPTLRRHALDYFQESLRGHGYGCYTLHYRDKRLSAFVDRADIVIMYRFVVDASDLVRTLKEHGKIVVGHYDDYFWDDELLRIEERHGILATMEEMHVLSGTSQYLLRMMPFDRPKIFRPAAINADLFRDLEPKSPAKHLGVGVFGGNCRKEQQSFFRSVLDGLSDCEHRIRFYHFGVEDSELDFYAKFQNDNPNIDIIRLSYVGLGNWRAHYKKLKTARLDVVLNYLPDDQECMHAKSHMKFVEAGALGAALLTSKMRPFATDFRDGEEILFAKKPDQFAKKILKLASDPDEARIIGQTARSLVRKRFLMDKVAVDFVNNLRAEIDGTSLKKILEQADLF
jgi:hypothetical protein